MQNRRSEERPFWNCEHGLSRIQMSLSQTVFICASEDARQNTSIEKC
ncbi:MAG: hypothetical protein K0S38_217 [Candidatus Paceibacter sp.]|jgi:hypothetical protein|nr:hypothetical protein [Candidatus Paceibacter sp.]